MRRMLAMLLAVVCASNWAGPRAATAIAGDRAAFPVIASLHGRKQTITIFAGATEPTYAVQTPDGSGPVRDLTLGQLGQKKPGAYRFVQQSQASTLWAGVDAGE